MQSWYAMDWAPSSTSLITPARNPPISNIHQDKQIMSILGIASLMKRPHSCRQSSVQPAAEVWRKKTKQTPLKDGHLFKHSLEDHAVVKKTDLPMWLCVDPSSRCKHIGTKPANTATWHWLLQIHFSSTMSRRSDQK